MGFFSKLTKIAINTATLPVSVAKDVITLGGAMTDKEDPYTIKKFKDIGKDYDKMLKSLDD